MAISKVTLNGVTLMDVTSDTVEANTLLSGNTATKNDGTKVTGSYTPATPMYQEKTISPTTSVQVVTPDTTYDALSQVTVNAIPSEYVVPTGTLAISQNGTVNVKNYEYANVNVEGGGGTTADESLPVRFLDYDGTVVYSYTAEDFANLTAMPSNPSHTGLTAQGWNWTLADAKEQVAEMGECDIGQMYVTDDGRTRIYIELESEDRLSPYLCIAPNGVVEIDWGDGSTEQVDGTSVASLKNFQHIYSAVGKYVISLRMINSAHVSIYGGGASGILKYKIGNETTAWTYLRAVYKIEIGENCSLGASALKNCYNLQTITIPQDCTIGAYAFYGCSSLQCVIFPSITTTIIGAASIQNYVLQSCSKIVAISLPNGSDAIGMYAFAYCGSLKRLVIPHTVTAINQNALVYCYDLKSIYLPSGIATIANSMASGCRNVTDLTIPDSVTVINATAFSNCGAISKVIIPSGVTSIGNQAFGQTYSVKEYHILPTTPPTAGTSIFNNRLADSTIYVPAESLEAYKTATNWSTYADYMVGE